MVVRRIPSQNDPDFQIRLKKLQGEIQRLTGQRPSLTELTKRLLKTQSFEDVEREVLSGVNESERIKNGIKFD